MGLGAHGTCHGAATNRAAARRMADLVTAGAIKGRIDRPLDAPVPGGVELIDLLLQPSLR